MQMKIQPMCCQFSFLFRLVMCVTGITGDRNQNLTGPSDGNMNIFLAHSLQCEGRLVAWEFFSKQAGDIYLDVWRYVQDEQEFTLVGKNLVTVDEDGAGYSNVGQI